MQELTDLLTELVRTPSVNPAHTEDHSIANEARMADVLGPHLEARGLTLERLELLGPDRPALIARGPEAPHTLMFDVHLDTVGIDHMTIDPFDPLIKDGRLYGRGSCDMKGATAALLHAVTPDRIHALADRGVQLIVVATPDEECGMGGAMKLAEQGLRADALVVLEPTRCRPVIAHKGAHWYELELRGRSGHGSNPDAGVSTNAALIDLLPRIMSIHQELADAHTHPILSGSTLNFGRIAGGRTFNIVPDCTRLLLDRRVVPSEPDGAFQNAIEVMMDEAVDRGHLVSGTCRRTAHTHAFATPASAELVKALRTSIQNTCGEDPEPDGTSWVSDASAFCATSGQTLVFGPGDIAQAHTEDEFIELDQLERASRILGAFLDRYSPPSP